MPGTGMGDEDAMVGKFCDAFLKEKGRERVL